MLAWLGKLEGVAKLLVPGMTGFLLGLLVVAWIDPRTSGGFLLIIFTCVCLCIVGSAAAAAMVSVIGTWRRAAARRAQVVPAPVEGSSVASVNKPSLAKAAPSTPPVEVKTDPASPVTQEKAGANGHTNETVVEKKSDGPATATA